MAAVQAIAEIQAESAGCGCPWACLLTFNLDEVVVPRVLVDELLHRELVSLLFRRELDLARNGCAAEYPRRDFNCGERRSGCEEPLGARGGWGRAADAEGTLQLY